MENRIHFQPLEIDGVSLVVSDIKKDNRGTFTRVWDKKIFIDKFNLKQANVACNPTKGTLRGLHFQKVPFSETKLVQCITGKVFDVIIDLRKNSKSYKKFFGTEIGPECEYQGILVPKGCAHGYLTMQTNSTILYFVDEVYSPMHSQGILWTDLNLATLWPFKPVLISEQDLNWPKFED